MAPIFTYGTPDSTKDIPLFFNKSEKLILANLTNVTGNNRPITHTIIHLTFSLCCSNNGECSVCM